MFRRLTRGKTTKRIFYFLLQKLARRLKNSDISRRFGKLLEIEIKRSDILQKLIDNTWYLKTNEDLANSNFSGQHHFLVHGQFEGRDPNPFFDLDWYQLNYKNELIENNLTPLLDYIQNQYCRNPNPIFATNKIIQELPEIGAINDNPLSDFLSKYSKFENRIFSNFDKFHSLIGLYYPEIYYPISCCMPNSYLPKVNNLFNKNKRTALIISVHNKWAYTQRCLDSIVRTNMLSKVDIYIIDDCSTDQTSKQLLKIPYLKKVLTNKTNLGYLKSVNLCYEYISMQDEKYDFIGLINNDVEFLANSLDFVLNQFDKNPSFGCISPKVIYPDGKIQEFGALLWDDGSASQLFHNLKFEEDTFLMTNHLMECSYVSAACTFIRTKTLNLLGQDLFDENFCPAYYEDVDLCLRIRQSGFKVGVFGGSYVIHHEGISHGTNLLLGIKAYQSINQGKLVKKWGNKLSKFSLSKNIPLKLVEDNTFLLNSNKKIILVIDDKLPNPMSGGGEARMLTILNQLKLRDFCIVFMPVGQHAISEDKNFYSNFGTRVERISKLDSAINEINYYAENGFETYCLISRPDTQLRLGNYIKYKLSNNTKFIFDCVDLFHTFPDEKDPKFVEFLHSISSYNYIWTVNEKEKIKIQKILPISENKIEVCPMLLDLNPNPIFEETQDLLLIGSLGHPPNQKMVLNVIHEVLPKFIDLKEKIYLKIVGVGWESWLKKEYPNLDLSNIIFKEYVPDISTEIRSSRIMIAPLTEGSGIKIKVLDSIRNGIPVIGSKIAWEGICESEEIKQIAVDDLNQYTKEINELYWNKDVWEEAQLKQSNYCDKINSKFLRIKLFANTND